MGRKPGVRVGDCGGAGKTLSSKAAFPDSSGLRILKSVLRIIEKPKELLFMWIVIN